MGEAQLTGRGSARRRAFGSDLAACFGLPEPPTFERTLQGGFLAVSELSTPNPTPRLTPSIGYDDAFQVVVQLKRVRREVWLNQRFHLRDTVEAGATYISDLRREPRVRVMDPIHNVQFYMPISTLKAFAERNDMPSFVEFSRPFSVGPDDPVTRQIASAVSAALAHPHEASGLLLDSLLSAACAHVLMRYGSLRSRTGLRSDGLAPWQERRAKDLMDATLQVSLTELADECGLSVAHFARAFKRSTGMAPHQWQIARRLSRAQALLAASTL